MFRRVLLEDWQEIAPIIAFALSFLVFLTALVRTMLTRRERCRELASMPLDDGQTNLK
jgi:hypothetical protein